MNIFFLYFISFLTRLLFLFFGMPSITHDEADFYTNSYILAKTGSDIWNKKIFFTTGILGMNASLPIYIGSLIFKFIEKNIFNGRLSYVILNSLTPLFIYLLIKKITKNKTLSYLIFFVFNFSPFFIHMSPQAGLEQTFSLLFLIISFYSFISIKNNFWKNLLFMIFSFLSFNSYMGIKPLFPFLLITIFQTEVFLKNKALFFKKIPINIIKSIAIFLLLMMPIILNSDNQLFNKRLRDEIIPLNTSYLENVVWFERLTTNTENNFLKKIISNKATVIINEFLKKYFEAFNLKYLFVTGDPHPIYGTNIYGIFYLWQMFFLIYGFILSFSKIPKELNLILIFLTLISPLGLSLSKNPPTIVLRAITIFIPYSFYIAFGIYQFIESVNKKYKIDKKILNLSFIFLIFLSFIHFFFLYQLRIKVLSSEQWHLGEKKLFEKILNDKNLKNKKITIINAEPKETFLLYAFYHLDDAFLIKEKLQKNLYQDKNIYFIKNCPKNLMKKNNEIYIIKRGSCKIETLESANMLKVYLESSDKSGPLYFSL